MISTQIQADFGIHLFDEGGGRPPTVLAPEPAAGVRDGLGDATAMYLRAVRRMPTLTAVQEVELFRRREAAEAEVRTELYGLGFAAQAHLALAEQLLSRAPEDQGDDGTIEEPRGGRQVCPAHLRALARKVRNLDAQAARDFAAFQEAAPGEEQDRLWESCQRLQAELCGQLSRFAFGPPLVEGLLREADLARQDILLALHKLILADIRYQRLVAGSPANESARARPYLTEVHDQLTALECRVRQPAAHYLRAWARLATKATALRRVEEAIVLANLRLVVHVAKRYTYGGLGLLDLIQEGNLALMRLLGRFDYRRGCRFSTMAVWGIRTAIARAAANQGRLIRLPVHVQAIARRLQAVRHHLTQEFAREPSVDELAFVLQLPVKRIQNHLRAVQEPLSIHSPLPQVEHCSLADCLPDESIAPPGEAGDEDLRRSGLTVVLARLTEREREVITRRFGLDGEPNATLAEIGAQMGLTRERVRQIEGTILRKLRHPAHADKLRLAS